MWCLIRSFKYSTFSSSSIQHNMWCLIRSFHYPPFSSSSGQPKDLIRSLHYPVLIIFRPVQKELLRLSDYVPLLPVFTSIRLVNLKTTVYVIWSCHSKTIALIIFRLVQGQVLTSFNLVTPLSLALVIIFRLVQRLVESSFWPSHSTTKCVDVGCSHCALIGHTLNSFHLWLLRLSPYWIPTAQLWSIFFPQ